MQVGEVIRKYRKIRNMTQEEMAERLGVTAPAVNKWEKTDNLYKLSNDDSDDKRVTPFAGLCKLHKKDEMNGKTDRSK